MPIQGPFTPVFSQNEISTAHAEVTMLTFAPEESRLRIVVSIWESAVAKAAGKQRLYFKDYLIEGSLFSNQVNKYFANPAEIALVDFMVQKVEAYLLNAYSSEWPSWVQI